MRKGVKRALGLGVIAGVGYAAWRAWQARVPQRTDGVEWEAAPFPFPPVPHPKADAPSRDEPATSGVAAPSTANGAAEPWLEPVDGSCPTSHPVKAKVKSGIFHVPGGANYDRTQPDRCYVDESAAEADGLRRSKV